MGRYTFYTPYVINIDVGTQIILHHACYNCKFEKKKDVIDFIEEQGNEERIILRKTRTLSKYYNSIKMCNKIQINK